MTWRTAAACKGMDPGLFYDPSRLREAKSVCAGCDVRAECRTASGGEYGVWAGEPTRREHRYTNGGRNRGGISPGDGDKRHGTTNGYMNLGCRCHECATANRRYQRGWREGKAS